MAYALGAVLPLSPRASEPRPLHLNGDALYVACASKGNLESAVFLGIMVVPRLQDVCVLSLCCERTSGRIFAS